jgi:D-threo-aldose 1-dehydrogenase
MIGLPRLGLGCAPLGGLLSGVSDADARAVLDTALAHGVRFFDTAPYYGFGLSERRVGDALRGRDDVILSTKVGRLLKPGLPPDPAAYGWPEPLPFHPVFDYGYDAVMRSFEDSLQRLGRDRIDILLLHDIGPFTHPDPGEERRHFRDAMSGGYRALDELRRAGQVGAIGIGVNEVEVSLRVLDHGDWDLFLLAGRYTLLEQDPLGTLFPACARAGTRIIVGGPYNSGILVGGATWNYAAAPEAIRARVAAMRAVCDRHGVPLPAAALQFCLAHPVVASVIPGARNGAELMETLRWMETKIPEALWEDLRGEGLLDPAAPTPRRQASPGAS